MSQSVFDQAAFDHQIAVDYLLERVIDLRHQLADLDELVEREQITGVARHLEGARQSLYAAEREAIR